MTDQTQRIIGWILILFPILIGIHDWIQKVYGSSGLNYQLTTLGLACVGAGVYFVIPNKQVKKHG